MNPNKLRSVLNILFLVLALATVAVYLIGNRELFVIVGCAAIFFKLLEFIIRFINR